jgi:hypothetical protein
MKITDYAILITGDFPREPTSTFDVVHIKNRTHQVIAQDVDLKEAKRIARQASPNVRFWGDCIYCGEGWGTPNYMVKNSVWQDEAGLLDGDMHFKCLEEQIGRRLTPDDFDLDLPVNESIAFGYQMALAEAGPDSKLDKAIRHAENASRRQNITVARRREHARLASWLRELREHRAGAERKTGGLLFPAQPEDDSADHVGLSVDPGVEVPGVQGGGS